MTIFNDKPIFTNGSMRLKLIAKQGLCAAFARLNEDDSEFDYIIGKYCSWDTKNMSVHWAWGSYPMHHDYDKIIKQLEKC